MFEDTLDWAAYQDEEGTVLEFEVRKQILIDHGHDVNGWGEECGLGETVGMGWVKFYQWLGYQQQWCCIGVYVMTERQEHDHGCSIIELLGLKVNEGRVYTNSGTKTPRGLFLTVKRLMTEATQSDR